MRRGTVRLLVLVCGLAAGCMHTPPGGYNLPPVPPGVVPGELTKITLPPYVIEPPDQLLIEVVAILRDADLVAKAAQEGKKPESVTEFKAYSLPVQPVSGQFAVGPEGMVFLGIWGRVPVAGLTLQQAAEAIREHIEKQEDPTKPGAEGFKKGSVRVILDVLQYNSKRYYVVTDGGGYGEQVTAFPITGSETVFDALANIGGLPAVASKQQIWVARRTPHAGQPEQILPVDWVAITQHGIVTTNYQIMPGDRVYVKAQKLIRLDTQLARIFSPIERMFGVVLLGVNTTNQISGRGTGFNGN